MATDDDVALSKYLSWVLRHDPNAVGLRPTPDGWVQLEALLRAIADDGRPTTADRVRAIVTGSDKQRFALSADGLQIRAQQGHSIPVALGYAPSQPPTTLFHGTVATAIPSIRAQGLRKGERHHVHLSGSTQTAARVGARRGQAIVLSIRARAMADARFEFFATPNGVWLVEHVPSGYIDFPPETDA